MAEIDQVTNFDGNYFRMVGVSLAKTLTKSIRWINRFGDKKHRVVVPFYLSLTGDEHYVLDAFVDDIVDKRVTLNTDQIPRGIITLESFTQSSDEFANPNQYITKRTIISDELRKIVSKIKAVPMTFSYKIEVVLASEIDVYNFSKKFLNMLFNYFFFSIDYYGLKIDAVLELPDDKTVEIPREIGGDLTDERKKKFEVNVDVRSYYPIFRIDTDDLEVCDNDGDIDWDRLDVPRPTSDFEKSLNNIPRSAYGDVVAADKVLWKSYIFEMKELKNRKTLSDQENKTEHDNDAIIIAGDEE